VVPLRSHLAAAGPLARRTYDAILRAIRACGPFTAVPTKSGINLMVRTSLGGVKLARGHVDLGLVLQRRVEHPRLKLRVQLSPRSVAYCVRVTHPREVDAEVRAWIREAYEVGKLAGRRPV
jgi:hypothetical protein